jgi:hypothetical protein
LPAELLEWVLDAVSQIQHDDARARALGLLAPHLPAELLERALDTASQIQDDSARVLALGYLAPHLPAELLERALDTVSQIQDDYDRALALQGFVARLSWAGFEQWCAVLRTLAALKRKDFIEILPNLRAGLVQFGGEEVIVPVVEAMQAVCAQWR